MKKIAFLFFISCFFLSPAVHGKTSKAKMKARTRTKIVERAPATESSSAKSDDPSKVTLSKPSASRLKREIIQGGMGITFWHESIKGSRGAQKAIYSTEFQGFKLQGSYLTPLNNVRWVPIYTGMLSLGSGIANGTGDYTETLTKQHFFGMGVSGGMLFRFNNTAEIGLAIPLEFRSTAYKIESQTILERANTFSYGLTFMMITRISQKSAIQVGLTHQQVWNATQWNLAYTFDLHNL